MILETGRPKDCSDRISAELLAYDFLEKLGIEFDRVYVVGNRMSRNEKYIAYTRALSNLVVVVDDAIQGIENDTIGRGSVAV